MGYFEISERAMTISDQVKLNLMARQHIFPSPWALLCAAIACALIAMFLRRRANSLAIMQKLPEKGILDVDKEFVQDSPFFVYLGHNAITESGPQNVGNTSRHAIDRMSKHIKSRNAIAALAAEPDSYNLVQPGDYVGKGQWRSYSYAGTSKRQVSFSHVRQMRNEEHGRQ